MLLHPIILGLAVPLSISLAAPIDKSSDFYTIVAPTSLPRQVEEVKLTCYRRWRRHSSHLTFRLARLDVVCGGRERSSHGLAESNLEESRDGADIEAKRIPAVIPRHRHVHREF